MNEILHVDFKKGEVVDRFEKMKDLFSLAFSRTVDMISFLEDLKADIPDMERTFSSP